MSKEYKALFVPAELHAKIKVAAANKKISIIEYLNNLRKSDVNKFKKINLWEF